jgi:hypothetical protein
MLKRCGMLGLKQRSGAAATQPAGASYGHPGGGHCTMSPMPS